MAGWLGSSGCGARGAPADDGGVGRRAREARGRVAGRGQGGDARPGRRAAEGRAAQARGRGRVEPRRACARGRSGGHPREGPAGVEGDGDPPRRRRLHGEARRHARVDRAYGARRRGRCVLGGRTACPSRASDAAGPRRGPRSAGAARTARSSGPAVALVEGREDPAGGRRRRSKSPTSEAPIAR